MNAKRMQYQAFVNRLSGLKTTLNAADLSGYLQACWVALDTADNDANGSATLDQLLQAIFRTQGPAQERIALLGMLRSLSPEQKPGRLPTLSQLARSLPPLEWLWPGWIPRGMVTLMGAVSGAGKSLVALDLADRILKGTSFPDGQPVLNPGTAVIYVDAEAATSLLYQRALDWGVDMDRLFMKIPESGGLINMADPNQRDSLAEEVMYIKPELLVIDAFSNMSSRGENNVENVRDIMMFFTRLAQESRAGLLLIHHTRKGPPFRGRSYDFTMDDVRGSGHLIAMSRSVIGLNVVRSGPKPDQNGPRLMRLLKTNLGPFPPSLGFELIGNESGSVCLKWGPPPAETIARPTALDACREWLQDTLRQHGEMKPGALAELAREAGFSKSMLYQARNALGDRILTNRPKHDPETTWSFFEN